MRKKYLLAHICLYQNVKWLCSASNKIKQSDFYFPHILSHLGLIYLVLSLSMSWALVYAETKCGCVWPTVRFFLTYYYSIMFKIWKFYFKKCKLKLNYRKKVFYFALNFLPWEFLLIKSWISKKLGPPSIQLLKLI